jgi:hypothetical protein
MSEREVVIPMMGIMLPLILVPTILRMKFAQRRREWAHKERMRAMELGLTLPDERPATFWPSLAAIAIGAGVPISSFVFAWLARLTTGSGENVYAAAVGVGVIAVLCGTILAARAQGSCGHKKSRADGDAIDGLAKPAHFDPDAYDTVGRRG